MTDAKHYNERNYHEKVYRVDFVIDDNYFVIVYLPSNPSFRFISITVLLLNGCVSLDMNILNFLKYEEQDDFKLYIFPAFEELPSREDFEKAVKEFVKQQIDRSGHLKVQCLFGSMNYSEKSDTISTDDKSYIVKVIVKSTYDVFKNSPERLLNLLNIGVIHVHVKFTDNPDTLIPKFSLMPLRFLYNQTRVQSPRAYYFRGPDYLGHSLYDFRMKAGGYFPKRAKSTDTEIKFFEIPHDFYTSANPQLFVDIHANSNQQIQENQIPGSSMQ